MFPGPMYEYLAESQHQAYLTGVDEHMREASVLRSLPARPARLFRLLPATAARGALAWLRTRHLRPRPAPIAEPPVST